MGYHPVSDLIDEINQLRESFGYRMRECSSAGSLAPAEEAINMLLILAVDMRRDYEERKRELEEENPYEY